MAKKEQIKRLSLKQLKDELDGLKDKIISRGRFFKITTGITTTATIIIAFVTGWYLMSTRGILKQMRLDYELHDTNYQKTIRPFVFVSNFNSISYYENNETFIDINYFVKNIGNQPAKITQLTMNFKKEKIIPFDIFPKTKPAATSGLYPNQELRAPYRHKKQPLEYFNENKYIYIQIKYKDARDQEYYYKSISLIKGISSTDYDVSIIWTDFN